MKTATLVTNELTSEARVKWDEFLDLYSLFLKAPVGELRENLLEKAGELEQLGQESIMGFEL
jgi:hypothetical protein